MRIYFTSNLHRSSLFFIFAIREGHLPYYFVPFEGAFFSQQYNIVSEANVYPLLRQVEPLGRYKPVTLNNNLIYRVLHDKGKPTRAMCFSLPKPYN